ncbi:class I SAM-dependent methyltransferase [Treponema brennaborense]|uniref:rRNA (Guanine-N(2)-)-methyltransferase n=1 Tax=Treponema brennaborense (strain DSM 12168 / CIP 105900 / DD5/3) TaxID=906968 RepID=F4LPN6_TREBD|nr:class I SAM-dependent methyltransferase [Treponema brennaborense]AEE17032.1 rRNA (guanine-N(2)-)-methyltransferase [Treponema brennaborense DSM 12168]
MSDESETTKNAYQAQLFANRLSKRYKHLRKWAKRERISCYRLYDRDIPEIPLAADLYEALPPEVCTAAQAVRFVTGDAANAENPNRYLHLFLYERPYEKSEASESAWLDAMADAAASVLGLARNRIIVKTRRRQRGTDSQYEKREAETSVTGTVLEQGQLFYVNLTDYLDTGLFFDHRPLRKTVRDTADGKRVLNLFCYTGSFSVYAAQGGAASVDSVDLSNTYLGWARRNMELNEFTDQARYRFVRADAASFLKTAKEKWDIIILDPPTFSNSKKTETELDVNRDWAALATDCLNLLSGGGVLYFSTNSRKLVFDAAALPSVTEQRKIIQITDITEQTIPEDYRNTKIHRCWKLAIGR